MNHIEKLLEKINDLYAIKVTSSEKVTKGFLSENYFLSDGKNKFFLKKYRFDNSERVAEIHASKKYFAGGGIPVILPIPLLDSKTFFEDNGAYYALFPFVDARNLETGSLTPNAIVSLGQTLGRIHLLGRDSKLVINDHFKIENEEKTFIKIENILSKIPKADKQSDFDKIALLNIELKRDLLLKTQFKNATISDFGLECDHLIHGDYLDQNVFFDDNDNVNWVFDFEKTNYSPRTYELFRSMIYGFLSAENITSSDLNNVKKYLEAYSSVYPISKDEIKRGLELYFFKMIHGFWVEGEHYLKNNTRVDHFLQNDYWRVKYLSDPGVRHQISDICMV